MHSHLEENRCISIWRENKIAAAHFDQGHHFNVILCVTVAVVGFTNGTVHVLDALTLNDETAEPFHYARDAITQIVFSHDSRFFATAVSPVVPQLALFVWLPVCLSVCQLNCLVCVWLSACQPNLCASDCLSVSQCVSQTVLWASDSLLAKLFCVRLSVCQPNCLVCVCLSVSQTVLCASVCLSAKLPVSVSAKLSCVHLTVCLLAKLSCVHLTVCQPNRLVCICLPVSHTVLCASDSLLAKPSCAHLSVSQTVLCASVCLSAKLSYMLDGLSAWCPILCPLDLEKFGNIFIFITVNR